MTGTRQAIIRAVRVCGPIIFRRKDEDMKSNEACEMLGLNRAEFVRLVDRGRIRIVNYRKGGGGHDYNERDVRQVYAERRRQQQTAQIKTILTPKVKDAAGLLKEALEEAMITRRLTREEAAGKLSRFISDLWDECEALTDKLPGKLRAA